MARQKQKTHSGAKKRFRFSKNGKIKRDKANRSHILTKKSTKRKRGLRKPGYVAVSDEKSIKELLPYK